MMDITFIKVLLFMFVSLLFGITMKGADLCNEHKCKFFPFDKYILGVAWGVSGVVIIFFHSMLGNIYAALILVFIFRAKIDHINHVIGAVLVLIGYIFRLWNNSQIYDFVLLIHFFLIFIITGFLHDYLKGRISRCLTKCELVKTKDRAEWCSEVFHTLISYVLIPLFFSLYLHNSSFYLSFILFAFGYELTRILGPKLSKGTC